MNIGEKLFMGKEGLLRYGPINIVIFGDSVSHGAFEGGIIDYENVYWNRLKKKINSLRSYVPVNIIDSAVGGETASSSVSRIERDILRYQPDLVIVCFGLNDVNDTVESFVGALSTIFEACNQNKLDAICMSPNMMNTYVCDEIIGKPIEEYACKIAKMQTDEKQHCKYRKRRTFNTFAVILNIMTKSFPLIHLSWYISANALLRKSLVISMK